MPKVHWIDANVFMHAQNGLFDIELVPSFWTWLETRLKDGRFCSSLEVYAELVAGKPEPLHNWAKRRREFPYWKDPLKSKKVQEIYADVSEHVMNKYGNRNPGSTAKFLSCSPKRVIVRNRV